jgi:hypothetical protein
MDITLTPDTYIPSVDENGNYIDKIPKIKNGLYCSCGARKDKVYETLTKFSTHTKSKIHQKWISNLNNNKANYYVELIKSKELVEQQQKILIKLETQLQTKSLTIDYLTNLLESKNNINNRSVNLLDLDNFENIN